MVGNDDTNFCPLSYQSFKNNLTPQIYTGDYKHNIRFLELEGQYHGGVNAVVGAQMNDVDSNLIDFYKIQDTAYDCDTRDTKEDAEKQFKKWCLKNPTNPKCDNTK